MIGVPVLHSSTDATILNDTIHVNKQALQLFALIGSCKFVVIACFKEPSFINYLCDATACIFNHKNGVLHGAQQYGWYKFSNHISHINPFRYWSCVQAASSCRPYWMKLLQTSAAFWSKFWNQFIIRFW